jgi:glucose/arabinose dehydrogenase
MKRTLLLLRILTISTLTSHAFPSMLLAQNTVTGQAAFADYSKQKPGVRRKITVADLPKPHSTDSIENRPILIPRPTDAWPLAPKGFSVQLYAGGDAPPLQRADYKRETHPPAVGTFVMPRLIRTAPNGDLFLSDSQAGRIMILRGVSSAGKANQISVFADGLDHPFGIAFYPRGNNPEWVYIATATTVVRFPYKSGDLKASATPQTIVPDLPGFAELRGGGHWTRDVVFSADGKTCLSR